ncbi:hypothetical protein D3C87_2082190 [compost metagenome]
MNWQSSTGIVPMTEVGLAGRSTRLRTSPPLGPKLVASKLTLSSTSITAGPSIRQLRNVRPDRIR